ncbi:MAG: hypothetical protein JO090_16110, partial [Rhizobacter sp.]|nr:hypothetical protein [Rhizobacter sp.]
SSVELLQSFERAVARLDEVPGHPLRALFLSALGLAQQMRGEAAKAAAVAQRSEALWKATGDRAALVCACMVHGLLARDAGRIAAAREWLERGIGEALALDASTSRAVFVADPAVLMLGLLALVLHDTGLVDDARTRLQAARERADALGQTTPRQAVCWLEALLAVRMHDPERVADAAARLSALQEEDYGMPEGKAAALWFRGWALAQRGDPREGHRVIREGHGAAARIGVRGFAGETLGYAAEALLLAGDAADARRTLDEAVRSAEATGERSALPQLSILAARIESALGDEKGARASLLDAIAQAREQGAAWLELLALTACCERGDATRAERSALGALLDRLDQARGTAAFARATALLGWRATA